jgi:integrase
MVRGPRASFPATSRYQSRHEPMVLGGKYRLRANQLEISRSIKTISGHGSWNSRQEDCCMTNTALVLSEREYPLEMAVSLWLHEKTKRSGSMKTLRAYKDTLESLRATLRRGGLDLDSPTREVSTVIQGWAMLHKANGDPVAPSTHNQRLAIVSSFYAFVAKRQLLALSNPVQVIERRYVDSYAGAHALEAGAVQSRMKTLERTTLPGKRDYALISVALSTGRRLSELANMRLGTLQLEGEHITVTFKAKGGKAKKDKLSGPVARALADYLGAIYPGGLAGLPADTPIWLDLHNHTGKALSTRSISNIWKKRLGTSKVHATRHTFAAGMEQVGAKVSVIQERLGHTSLAVTSRYLASLGSAENKFRDQLGSLFGIS